jgi:hypothetical protein
VGEEKEMFLCDKIDTIVGEDRRDAYRKEGYCTQYSSAEGDLI